jgi:8-oxo-dGTP pyrophosphatase MutT (NUDIX family)
MIYRKKTRMAEEGPVRELGEVMDRITPAQIMRSMRPLLGAEPIRLQVAALPWRHTKSGIEIMLITSRTQGRWVLPKGWPETGEELCTAAAREAHEEAGLLGAISSSTAGHYGYLKTTGSDGVRCEVMVYPLEVGATASKWKEKGKRRRKWFAPERAAEAVAEPQLGDLIRQVAIASRAV